MDADTLYRCTDPFMTTRTARRVGLGIALFKLSAEQSGGSFTIRSEQGRGTRAEAAYSISGIDRAPLGSIAETDCGESRNGLYFGIRGGRQSLCLRNGHDTIS